MAGVTYSTYFGGVSYASEFRTIIPCVFLFPQNSEKSMEKKIHAREELFSNSTHQLWTKWIPLSSPSHVQSNEIWIASIWFIVEGCWFTRTLPPYLVHWHLLCLLRPLAPPSTPSPASSASVILSASSSCRRRQPFVPKFHLSPPGYGSVTVTLPSLDSHELSTPAGASLSSLRLTAAVAIGGLGPGVNGKLLQICRNRSHFCIIAQKYWQLWTWKCSDSIWH